MPQRTQTRLATGREKHFSKVTVYLLRMRGDRWIPIRYFASHWSSSDRQFHDTTQLQFCLDLDASRFVTHTQSVMNKEILRKFMFVIYGSGAILLSHPVLTRAAVNKSNFDLTPPPLTAKIERELVYNSVSEQPHFDLPVTYNSKVRHWVMFFQNNGKRDFKRWLERSERYLPKILPVLEAQGLPRDLAYLAMIESGFSPRAVSSAEAVGYWQFMKPTAERYHLRVEWWLDERRDIIKSTVAAAKYLHDLYRMFDSWYLAAAAYNMGEGRVKGLIKKYQTKNYWTLSKKKEFPKETEQYIPKLIAAMLIAKSPKLYGFRDLKPLSPRQYEVFKAPGGTDLENLSLYLGVERDTLALLNPEITQGFIPHQVDSHPLRIPVGRRAKAAQFARSNLVMSN
jgi:membrane-bound lytic murein transglycosylase D